MLTVLFPIKTAETMTILVRTTISMNRKVNVLGNCKLPEDNKCEKQRSKSLAYNATGGAADDDYVDDVGDGDMDGIRGERK